MSDRPTAVYCQILPGTIGCLIGCEEECSRRNFLWQAHALQHRHIAPKLHHRWVLLVTLDMRASRVDNAGADGVDADAPFAKIKRNAMARPMPVAPPVISVTLFARRMIPPTLSFQSR
jgi:hypothetical protein